MSRLESRADFRGLFKLIDDQTARIVRANGGRDGEIADAVSIIRYETERVRKDVVKELDLVERAIVALLQELHCRVTSELFEEISKAAGVRIGSKPVDQGGH